MCFCAFSVTLRASTSSDSAVWNTKASYLNGVYPAHAEHHLFFLKKDNRTVILTRQDFLSDRTADGDLLFTFSSNILDFRRSPSSINWLAARRLISILSLARSPRDPKSSFRSFRSLIKQLFCRETTGSPSWNMSIGEHLAGVLASKLRKIKLIKIQSQRDEASQRLVKHNIMI